MENRLKYIIIGFLLFILLGIPCSYTLLILPIEKIYHTTRIYTSTTMTLFFICFYLGTYLSKTYLRKIPVINKIRIVGILLGIGLIVSGIVKHIFLLYLTYSLICGLSTGIGYDSILNSIPLWFHNSRDMAKRLLIVCFILSSIVIAPIMSLLMSTFNMTVTFISLGILVLVSYIVCSYQLKVPKQTYENTRIIRTRSFYYLLLSMTLLTGVGLSLMTHISPILQEDFSMSTSFTTLMIVVSAGSTGLGHIVFGHVFDHIGLRMMVLLDILLYVLGGLCLFIGISMKLVMFFIAGIITVMIAFGGSLSNYPHIIKRMHQSHHQFYIIPASLMITVIGYLQSQSHNYNVSILIILITIIISFISDILLIRNYRRVRN